MITAEVGGPVAQVFLEKCDTVAATFDRDGRWHFIYFIKMTKKRGGFFGALWNGIKSFVAPAINAVKGVVGNLFGGAKKKAVQVAHQAINTVAQGAQQALATGNVRQAAQQSYSTIKNNAMSTARQQYDHSRNTLRREASRQIDYAHRDFTRRAQQHYSSIC